MMIIFVHVYSHHNPVETLTHRPTYSIEDLDNLNLDDGLILGLSPFFATVPAVFLKLSLFG